MSNTISSNLSPVIIGEARKALRQSMALISRANLDASGTNMARGKKGASLSVGVPAALTAGAITANAYGPDPTAITVGAATVTMDQFYSAKFFVEGTENQNYVLERVFMEQMKEAIRAVAYQMNASIHALYKKISISVGTAGTGIFASDLDPLADGRRLLKNRLCPDQNLDLVLSTKDYAALMKLDAIQYSSYAGDSGEALRSGRREMLMGFQLFQDQQVTTHTTGTVTSPSTAAGPNVGTAGAAAGATSIPVTCATGDGLALKEGDLITFSADTSKVYAVADDLTVTAGNTGTLTIYHGLESAVTSASVIKLYTGHGTSLVNIAGDMRGFTFVNRLPSAEVLGVPVLGSPIDFVDGDDPDLGPGTGIGMSLFSYPQGHRVAFEVAALWGVDVTDYRRLLRVYSYAS